MAFSSLPITTVDSTLTGAQGVAAIQKAHDLPSATAARMTNILNLINANSVEDNSIFQAPDASAATLTLFGPEAALLAAHPTLTEELQWRFNINKFTPCEAIQVLQNGIGARLYTTSVIGAGNISAGKAQVGPSWSFYTDAQLIGLKIGKTNEFTVEINSKFLSRTSSQMTTGDGNDSNASLEFSDKSIRKITINFNTGGNTFQGVRLSPTDNVWATENELSLIFFGDSFGTGTDTNPSGYSYPVAMSKALGVGGYQISAVGGTGFSSNISGAGYNYNERYVSDATHRNWDVVCASSSTNDVVFTESEINASVDAFYNLVKSNHPKSIILIVGSPRSVTPRPSGENGNFVLTEQYTLARFESKNDPLVITIPTLTDVSPPVFGTGKISAPTGDGNADFYVSDGLHYGDAGHLYHGSWLARKVKAAFKAKIIALSA